MDIRGPIGWPLRSPDLTPLYFFLWGYLKSIIHLFVQPADVDPSAKSIVYLFVQPADIDVMMNVKEKFENRLSCLPENGQHFK